MDITKDNYYIDFSISTCSFEIRVNDIPALRYYQDGSVSTRMYINHLVEPGANTLVIDLLPQSAAGFEMTTMCTAKVFHRINEDETLLAEVAFAFDYKNPVHIAKLSAGFTVNNDQLKESLWKKNNVKELTDKQKEELHATFARLMNLYRKGDIDSIMREGIIKDNHFIERYHYNKAERLAYIRNYFDSKFKDKDWQFVTYFDNQYLLKQYAGNRLYTFELADFNSPLEIRNAKAELKLNVPVMFTYYEGKIVWVL